MSLTEPLLPKEEVEDQNLEKYSNDPLANLEKSIETLSVEFKSYEINGTSDIEFANCDLDSNEMNKFYGDWWVAWDIRCAATFENKLVISRIDGIIKIYDLETKKEIVLKGHSKTINCLQVTIKQDFLVSGSRDKTIIIWNLNTYKEERVYKADSEVFCLEVTSGYNLFSGSLSDGLIRKLNFWDENEISTLSGHESGVTCMKSSKNNRFLVTGSMDKSLRIWSIENIQELKVFKEHSGFIYQILITEDDKYIISLSTGYDIIIWDLYKREMIQKMHQKRNYLDINNISNCIFLDQRDKIAFYYIDNQLEIPGISVKDNIRAITCSKRNSLAYYGLANSSAHIIDTKSKNNLIKFEGFDTEIYKMLLIGNNDEYLASISEIGKIKIHEIYKENIQEDFAIDYSLYKDGFNLTKDGKYFILRTPNSLRIWNVIEKKYVFSYENKNLYGINISYDDKYFEFNDNRIIYIYSFQDMKEVVKFDLEYEDDNICVSFSKDSKFIAAGKTDGSIVVFDIEKRCKISTLEGLHAAIKTFEIDKNNDYLISADCSYNLIFWSFSEKKIIKSFVYDQKIELLLLNDKYKCVVVGINTLIEIWDFQKQIKIAKFQDVGLDNYIRKN